LSQLCHSERRAKAHWPIHNALSAHARLLVAGRLLSYQTCDNRLTLNGVLSCWRALAAIRRARLHFGGAVAQLGERLVRNEEVRGSTPLGSTI
jgi:hypothetical protein